jgi:hypothetical protein
MARQAEAERERRAKIINAEGEYQAAERLFDAAEIMSANPTALQLRYLQTLLELGSSQASTIVFPLPIDLLRPLLEGTRDGHERPARPRPAPPDEDDRGLEPAEAAAALASRVGGVADPAAIEAQVERVQGDADPADVAGIEAQVQRVRADVERAEAETAEPET